MSSIAQTREPGHSTRLSGAIVGILVFGLGVALIFGVFGQAKTLFDAPPLVIPASAFSSPTASSVPSPAPVAVTTGKNAAVVVVATPAPSGPPPAVALIAQNFYDFLRKLLSLLVMCIVSSVIAAFGVHLFFKALAAPITVVPLAPSAPGPTNNSSSTP